MADRALESAGSGDERGHRGRKSPVQRLLSPVEDVRSLGALVRDLHRIILSLETIAEHVISLDEEFKRMNQSVTEMRDEVKLMSGAVQPLDQRLQEVREGFERIEPMLDTMNLAIHPLRRARRKLGSNGSPAELAAEAAILEEDDAAARSADAS